MMAKPDATYHEHLTGTLPGDGCNYVVWCSCGWRTNLAARSDVQAAEVALEHVRGLQPPTTEELFARLGG